MGTTHDIPLGMIARLVENYSCVEILKKVALQVAENYNGKIKIEINVDNSKNDCKINVTDYDI